MAGHQIIIEMIKIIRENHKRRGFMRHLRCDQIIDIAASPAHLFLFHFSYCIPLCGRGIGKSNPLYLFKCTSTRLSDHSYSENTSRDGGGTAPEIAYRSFDFCPFSGKGLSPGWEQTCPPPALIAFGSNTMKE